MFQCEATIYTSSEKSICTLFDSSTICMDRDLIYIHKDVSSTLVYLLQTSKASLGFGMR